MMGVFLRYAKCLSGLVRSDWLSSLIKIPGVGIILFVLFMQECHLSFNRMFVLFGLATIFLNCDGDCGLESVTFR